MVRLSRIVLVTAAIGAFVMAATPRPPQLPGNPDDKVLHIVAFLVLGSLAAMAFPRWSRAWLIVALGLYGAAIEIVQAIPALHRDSSLLDLAADLTAAIVAVWGTRKALAMLEARRAERGLPPD